MESPKSPVALLPLSFSAGAQSAFCAYLPEKLGGKISVITLQTTYLCVQLKKQENACLEGQEQVNSESRDNCVFSFT